MKAASLWYSAHDELNLTEKDFKEFGHSYFSTHENRFARWAHLASQFCLLPFRKSLQYTMRALQPRPGENKDDRSITQTGIIIAFRICLGSLFLAFSVAIALMTLPIHLIALIGYKSRPYIGYIRPDTAPAIDPPPPSMEEDQPLTVCSYNLALMLSMICIVNDIRTPEERALEIADDILDNKDKYSPDVLCFQEVFHQDATQLLMEQLKEKYPYILYNVAPTAIGIGSGLAIASKYPFKSARFVCFKDADGEDQLAPKGILRCDIEVMNNQRISIYNTHLQAMTGRTKSKVRLNQMQQIKEMMEQDKQVNPMLIQVLLGDLNVSKFTVWDVSNEKDYQPDRELLDYMASCYNEPYYDDHNASGQRLSGTKSYFLEEDQYRIGDFPEPKGSWLFGPYAAPNNLISICALRLFSQTQAAEHFRLFSKHAFKKPIIWGTQQWAEKRPVTHALLDHILIPKESSITAQVEIRNTKLDKRKQSGSSDHLPLYGRLFRHKTLPDVAQLQKVIQF